MSATTDVLRELSGPIYEFLWLKLRETFKEKQGLRALLYHL